MTFAASVSAMAPPSRLDCDCINQSKRRRQSESTGQPEKVPDRGARAPARGALRLDLPTGCRSVHPDQPASLHAADRLLIIVGKLAGLGKSWRKRDFFLSCRLVVRAGAPGRSRDEMLQALSRIYWMNSRICDTWGYNYNRVYAVYMIDKTEVRQGSGHTPCAETWKTRLRLRKRTAHGVCLLLSATETTAATRQKGLEGKTKALGTCLARRAATARRSLPASRGL